MTPAEILSAMQEIENGTKLGDFEELVPDEVDLFLWLEPEVNTTALPVVPRSRLVVAARNTGPFRRAVQFKIETQKGAVALSGTVDGELIVKDMRGDRCIPNWDHCEAYAVVQRRKDDCVCAVSVNACRLHSGEVRVSIETR